MADHGGQRTRDLTLNETPCERQRSIRRFIEEVVTPTASAFEPTDQYPVVFVNRMAELGLCGMLIPEECGGLGLDSVSYAVGRRALAGLDESGEDNQLPPHAYPDDLEIWHVFPTTTLSTLAGALLPWRAKGECCGDSNLLPVGKGTNAVQRLMIARRLLEHYKI